MLDNQLTSYVLRQIIRTRRCMEVIVLCFCLILLPLLSCTKKQNGEIPGSNAQFGQTTSPNILTKAEKAAGWRLLFDGETFEGWRGLGRDTIPKGHWVIQTGTIKKVASGDVPLSADGQPLSGGDLMTIDSFENFELSFEWRISSGGNSGVKYNVSEELSTSRRPRYAALGFEYQVLDDDKHPDGEDVTHRAGALYDLIAPQNKELCPVGEFNQSRIVFQGNHGEHWLNGAKIVEYDLETPRMDSILAGSKYRDISGFGDKKKGHIVLQDHTDAVWYRNIKIRVLTPSQ